MPNLEANLRPFGAKSRYESSSPPRRPRFPPAFASWKRPKTFRTDLRRWKRVRRFFPPALWRVRARRPARQTQRKRSPGTRGGAERRGGRRPSLRLPRRHLLLLRRALVRPPASLPAPRPRPPHSRRLAWRRGGTARAGAPGAASSSGDRSTSKASASTTSTAAGREEEEKAVDSPILLRP